MLDKLEKLDKIEGYLNEVSASLASVEESIQFNEEDILDLKKESKFEINDLRSSYCNVETYSGRENVKVFGIDEVVPVSEVDSPPEDTRDLLFKFLENKLRIENPRGRIEFQRVPRLGKPDNSSNKPHPIIARFLRYSDKEMVMDQARKELKRQEDKQFSVFNDIPKNFMK